MSIDNSKYSKEWFEQAKYDLDTAKAMLEAGRFIYCVFMCHLSLEKAYKAFYVKRFDKNPPRVHSLVYFAQTLTPDMPKEHKEFIENIDEVSVPVRYPEELSKVLGEYDKARSEVIFAKSKEILEWLRVRLRNR